MTTEAGKGSSQAGMNEMWLMRLSGEPGSLPAISRFYRRLPAPPRCKACGAPFTGPLAPVLRLFGVKPWPVNEQLCGPCYRGLGNKQGGAEVPVSLLFTDVRDSTALAEQMSATEFSNLLSRFFKSVFRHFAECGHRLTSVLADIAQRIVDRVGEHVNRRGLVLAASSPSQP